MSAMGVKIDKFDVPVCNSFQAKVVNDQLCYEVDLNKFSDKSNIQKELDLGFNFFMDYNEDRQVTSNYTISSKHKDFSMASHVLEYDDQPEHSHIYFNTIGKK